MDKHTEWGLKLVEEACMFKANDADKEIVLKTMAKYCIPKSGTNKTPDEIADELLKRLHERNRAIIAHAERVEHGNIKRVNDTV